MDYVFCEFILIRNKTKCCHLYGNIWKYHEFIGAPVRQTLVLVKVCSEFWVSSVRGFSERSRVVRAGILDKPGMDTSFMLLLARQTWVRGVRLYKTSGIVSNLLLDTSNLLSDKHSQIVDGSFSSLFLLSTSDVIWLNFLQNLAGRLLSWLSERSADVMGHSPSSI